MIRKGDPFADMVPSATATIRSSMPNKFHAPIRRRFGEPRAAANARGMAKIPVMMSPHPADCGNGPPSLPAAASTRKNAPKMRMALRPTSTGIGIASSDARTAGEKLARATTVAIGVTNKIGMAAGFASPPAPATEAAKPIHVPATAANVRRWASSVGGGAVTATRQTAIAAVVATVPIRSNIAGSLHAYTRTGQRARAKASSSVADFGVLLVFPPLDPFGEAANVG